MLSCTLSMFWTTVTSQTSSEEEWMNRDTVKPTVTFGSRAGFKKGTLLLPCFHNFMQMSVNHLHGDESAQLPAEVSSTRVLSQPVMSADLPLSFPVGDTRAKGMCSNCFPTSRADCRNAQPLLLLSKKLRCCRGLLSCVGNSWRPEDCSAVAFSKSRGWPPTLWSRMRMLGEQRATCFC